MFVIRLANYLSQTHRVSIFCLTNGAPPRALLLLSRSVFVIYQWSFPGYTSKVARLFNALAGIIGVDIDFIRLLRNLQVFLIILFGRIDIISSHLFHSDRFISLAGAWVSPPICITDHGDYNYVLEQGIADRVDLSSILHRANLMIGICDKNIHRLKSLAARFSSSIKINKVYNGYELLPSAANGADAVRSGLAISPDSFVFGMVARGIEEKGWREALAAFERAWSKRSKECHLVLVGHGDVLESLQKTLPCPLNSFVHFVGFSANPTDWILSFDVALLPTYFAGESLPYSIIEYFAVHKPVIATDIGGIREMCTVDGLLAGTLVPILQSGGPCVDSIENAMELYINNPGLVASHALLAARAFEKFDISACADQYTSSFDSLIPSFSSHPGHDRY